MHLRTPYIILILGLHFFILFGKEHGAAFLGMSVIFVSWLFDSGIFQGSLNEVILLPIIGLCTLFGYLCLIISIMVDFKWKQNLKIIGLVFLWLSIIALLIGNQIGAIFSSIYFSIPFILVSLYPVVEGSYRMLGKHRNPVK